MWAVDGAKKSFMSTPALGIYGEYIPSINARACPLATGAIASRVEYIAHWLFR